MFDVDHRLYVGWTDMVEERIGNAIENFLKSKPKANESKVIRQSRIMYKSCMNLNTGMFIIQHLKMQRNRTHMYYSIKIVF